MKKFVIVLCVATMFALVAAMSHIDSQSAVKSSDVEQTQTAGVIYFLSGGRRGVKGFGLNQQGYRPARRLFCRG